VRDDILVSAADTALVDDRRAALIVRRVARMVAIPALLLMLGGLLAHGLSRGGLFAGSAVGLPGPDVESLAQRTDGGRLLASGAAMSVGLLALALIPVITVSWILIDYLRSRRWREAAVAATVVAIMALSAVLGKR
jgi:hypothetical protein